MKHLHYLLSLLLIGSFACHDNKSSQEIDRFVFDTPTDTLSISEKINEYHEVRLYADLSSFSDSTKVVISSLIDVSNLINELFWQQSFGDKTVLYQQFVKNDTLDYIEINFGPWDRFRANENFVSQYGIKPFGAEFYPDNFSYTDYYLMDASQKNYAFSVIRRSKTTSGYDIIPFKEYYAEDLANIETMLKQAATFCNNKQFGAYLGALAKAFVTDDYTESYRLWLQIEDPDIDFIAGPSNYTEDDFIHKRAAFQSILFVKASDCVTKLDLVDELVKEIKPPVKELGSLKTGQAMRNISVYNALYYSGAYNTHAKYISVNHPYSPEINRELGIKKILIRNTMQAKFKKILTPISKIAINPEQLEHMDFSSFLWLNLMYEIADGQRFSTTEDGKFIRDELKEYYSIINSMQADLLSIYYLIELYNQNHFNHAEFEGIMASYIADLFRSLRFGPTHPQAIAKIIVYSVLIENKAMRFNKQKEQYNINLELAVTQLENLMYQVLEIQKRGDYEAAKKMVNEKSYIRVNLQTVLNKIAKEKIPRDVKFRQGKKTLNIYTR